MLKHILKQSFKKNLIKGILILFIGFFIVGNALGNYETFLNNLKQTGIDVDSILGSDQVSRYELTRLLNAVNCEDCVNTPQWMINQYTNPRWSDFTAMPGKDFDDIGYKGGIYNGETYYYCVAYVGDNTRMRGYPAGLSPICDGKFCGNRNTTIGEFLQVVLNIADQYTYSNYLVNWRDIKTWMDGLIDGSYPFDNLNSDDRSLINDLSNTNMSGSLPNENSMQTYLKYCMFNLESCGMQSFGEIVQGYWPVAELNILYDHNIVEYEKFQNGDIHELAEGNYVLEILYNLFKLIDCDFDNNYDCDTLDNVNDNCPNIYNPHQTDTDSDGIGDVCDDDIDGDGILNPIGIVDDLGNIVISKRDNNMDNCLFMINIEQQDTDGNGLGDACEDSKNYLGMYIKTSGLSTTAPLTVKFDAITEGKIKGEISWDFGDGKYDIGNSVTHTFINDGLYKISVNASGINNDAHALTTVLVGKNTLDDYGIQIDANNIGGQIPSEIKFKINTKGNFDKFEWNFGDGNTIEKSDTKEIIKIFRDQKSYMVTVKGFKNGKITAVANMIVGVGDIEIGSKITANNLGPTKGQTILLSTKILGFTKNDIEQIEWHWGNEETEIDNKLTKEHIYKASGPRVIIQKIILKNGVEIQNFLTVNVRDEFLENSYGIETAPNKLIGNNFEDIRFKVNNVGYIPDILLILNRYMDAAVEKSMENLETRPKYFDYRYYKEGVFFPKTSVFINECIDLETTETIAIANNDICLEAMLNNTLDQYKCDMDNDGIPDICDNDIDGDGISNLIGIIKFEQEDCAINMDNINRDIIKEHNGTCGLDNCPSVENNNQMDLNNNGRGDACDELYYDNGDLNNENHNGKLDSDRDGILDSLDACPLIPENYNGIEDFDGCPEIGANINCDINNNINYNLNLGINGDLTDIPIITPVECLSCPCSFSDFSNDLILDDKIRAKLWDFDMNVLYSESIPESIRQYLN